MSAFLARQRPDDPARALYDAYPTSSDGLRQLAAQRYENMLLTDAPQLNEKHVADMTAYLLRHNVSYPEQELNEKFQRATRQERAEALGRVANYAGSARNAPPPPPTPTAAPAGAAAAGNEVNPVQLMLAHLQHVRPAGSPLELLHMTFPGYSEAQYAAALNAYRATLPDQPAQEPEVTMTEEQGEGFLDDAADEPLLLGRERTAQEIAQEHDRAVQNAYNVEQAVRQRAGAAQDDAKRMAEQSRVSRADAAKQRAARAADAAQTAGAAAAAAGNDDDGDPRTLDQIIAAVETGVASVGANQREISVLLDQLEANTARRAALVRELQRRVTRGDTGERKRLRDVATSIAQIDAENEHIKTRLTQLNQAQAVAAGTFGARYGFAPGKTRGEVPGRRVTLRTLYNYLLEIRQTWFPENASEQFQPTDPEWIACSISPLGEAVTEGFSTKLLREQPRLYTGERLPVHHQYRGVIDKAVVLGTERAAREAKKHAAADMQSSADALAHVQRSQIRASKRIRDAT